MSKQRGRFYRPKDKGLKGTGYDSNLEKRLHEGPLKPCKFHPVKLEYHVEHTYEPDFVVEINGKVIYIESKGFFQDASELQKYKWIKKSLDPDKEELVFVFEKADKPLHFKPKRKKTGDKMTHKEWALKAGFRVFSEEEAYKVLEET